MKSHTEHGASATGLRPMCNLDIQKGLALGTQDSVHVLVGQTFTNAYGLSLVQDKDVVIHLVLLNRRLDMSFNLFAASLVLSAVQEAKSA